MGTTMLSTTNVFCVKMTASKTSSLKESSRRYRRRRRRNDDGFATTTTRAKADGSKESNIFDKIANEANKMLDVMEGGPKLRKWYGEDSSVGKDGEVKREREKRRKV